jgi:hypothetical protein
VGIIIKAVITIAVQAQMQTKATTATEMIATIGAWLSFGGFAVDENVAG